MAYYRSFPVNYAMNIPFGSLIIAFNERLKYMFGVKEGDNSLDYYFCGALAGAIASIPTTPLDVVKTKLNTQGCTTNQCEKKVLCHVLSSKIERLSHHTHPEEMEFKSPRGKLWM
jgi:solute carrier family 25 iron transporter 28/37